MTDKSTTNRLNERLGEFSKFGMTFHYLLEQGRVAMNEIEEILFSKYINKYVASIMSNTLSLLISK